MDPVQHHGGLRRAHRLHEPRLAAGLPPARIRGRRRAVRRRGVPAVLGALQPLPAYRGPGGDVRPIRSDFRRSGERLLAGGHVVPGGGNAGAGLRGVHVHFHAVLPELPEEKHLQHLWTAPGHCRPPADGGAHAVPRRLGLGEGGGLLRSRGLPLPAGPVLPGLGLLRRHRRDPGLLRVRGVLGAGRGGHLQRQGAGGDRGGEEPHLPSLNRGTEGTGDLPGRRWNFS